jgi:hypothetical protein
MDLLAAILFWAGIVFLVDGSLGILLQEKYQKLAKGLDIQRIALIETVVGLVFLAGHYALCWWLRG